jgi:phosphoribosylformylglycinamidine (FGAM) synthase-like amidotransferase family enzyme
VLKIPIAHGEGNFIATDEVLQDIESNGQVVFRYASPTGKVERVYNPNGSQNNIAGIVSKEGNVFGMMPHPERACESILGSSDGLGIFKSLVGHFAKSPQMETVA